MTVTQAGSRSLAQRLGPQYDWVEDRVAEVLQLGVEVDWSRIYSWTHGLGQGDRFCDLWR